VSIRDQVRTEPNSTRAMSRRNARTDWGRISRHNAMQSHCPVGRAAVATTPNEVPRPMSSPLELLPVTSMPLLGAPAPHSMANQRVRSQFPIP
jgi:hypothetical protein